MHHQQENEVYALLRRLTPDHYVEVEWLDACEIRAAKPEDVDRGYRTLMVTNGRFHDLKNDYVVVAAETGSLGLRAVCIPLGCILNVKVLTRVPARKRPLRMVKTGARVEAVKVVRIYVKQNL